MGEIVSQITSLTIVYSTVNSDADERKHQSSASLAFVRGIHRGPMNSPHHWPATRKTFPFYDVIMPKLRVLSPSGRLVSCNMLCSDMPLEKHLVCTLSWFCQLNISKACSSQTIVVNYYIFSMAYFNTRGMGYWIKRLKILQSDLGYACVQLCT